MTKKRLLLVASTGGHWIQLSRLTPAFERYDAFYATTMRGVQPPSGSRPVKHVADASRTTPFLFMLLVLQTLWIVLTVRPHVVITTGAAPGLVALRIGRLFGAKTIWVDSLANSETLSLSGKLAERHADLWLTQWPHLVKDYPGLQCFGAVL